MGENYLEISKELHDHDMEALIEHAIDDEIIRRCERCNTWKYYTEIVGGRCEHCR